MAVGIPLQITSQRERTGEACDLAVSTHSSESEGGGGEERVRAVRFLPKGMTHNTQACYTQPSTQR